MLTIQGQIAQAHHLGKVRGRPRKAYKRLLIIAENTELDRLARTEAYHQAGVYALNAGELILGFKLLQQALGLANTNTIAGNIWRDLARYHLLRGTYATAIRECDFAISRHAGTDLVIVDQGFKGRILFAQGCKEQNADTQKEGLSLLAYVNFELMNRTGEDNRRLELYNLLHFASAMSRAREPKARTFADEARGLARRYGNWQHRLRAEVLTYFGWRGEWVLNGLLRPCRWLLNLLARLRD